MEGIMDSMAGQSGFSIIVCTFNGATRLAATLQSLAALNRQGCRVELIVVNNACTDDTDAVVAGTWHQSGTPFPMRLLHMPTPGKSFPDWYEKSLTVPMPLLCRGLEGPIRSPIFWSRFRCWVIINPQRSPRIRPDLRLPPWVRSVFCLDRA